MTLDEAGELTGRLTGTGWLDPEVVASTGSTNADLAAAAVDGRRGPGAVRVAWQQTAGRGRLTRVWSSPPGASAAVSVLVDAAGVAPARLPWLPLLTGLAVAGGIENATGLSPALKWPNDVLLGEKKVCGILAERLAGPGLDAVVVGFGLNLTQNETELPVPTATSLSLAGAAKVDRIAVVAAVLTELDAQLRGWRRDAGAVRAPYRTACHTLGREVVVQLPGDREVRGRAVDVDGDGRLVVETPTGQQAFAVGDVVHLRARG